MDHNGFHSAVRHACHHVPMAVRPITAGDLEQCQAIVRGLPDYFTDDVPEKVGHDLDAHQGWVVTENDGVAAFAVVDRRSQLAAEILWIAVRADRRRSRLGTTLLDHVLQALGADGVQLVEAKTLDGSAGYEPYVATRAFWERHGFVQVDAIDPLPGWRPGNPAAIYVCALRPTR
jgi:GNAT superfamily N-acetyltransferase